MVDVCVSLTQDGFQRKGVWEVGRTCCELVAPPLLSPETDDLLCARVQLGNPPDHKNEKNVVALSSAPVRALVLLASYLKVSAGEVSAAAQPGPTCLLPHST